MGVELGLVAARPDLQRLHAALQKREIVFEGTARHPVGQLLPVEDTRDGDVFARRFEMRRKA